MRLFVEQWETRSGRCFHLCSVEGQPRRSCAGGVEDGGQHAVQAQGTVQVGRHAVLCEHGPVSFKHVAKTRRGEGARCLAELALANMCSLQKRGSTFSEFHVMEECAQQRRCFRERSAGHGGRSPRRGGEEGETCDRAAISCGEGDVNDLGRRDDGRGRVNAVRRGGAIGVVVKSGHFAAGGSSSTRSGHTEC